MRVVTEVRSYNRRDLHASKDFMNARSIRIAASIAVPALILLLPIAVYLADRIANNGEIPRNVTVVGLDVGGLSRDDAIVVVREYETNLKSEKATFVVSGSTYELDPTSVGLTADVDGAVDVAMNQRSGGMIGGFVPGSGASTNASTLISPYRSTTRRLMNISGSGSRRQSKTPRTRGPSPSSAIRSTSSTRGSDSASIDLPPWHSLIPS